MADRRPLLLLPGLLCDAELWQAQVDGLADIADCRIADLTRDDSVAAMAARTLSIAPDRFALAALSMGGYVAFEILRQAPERVTRLALLDTSAAPDTPERAGQRRVGMESLKLGRFIGVTRRMLPQMVHPDHVDGPIGARVKAMAERVGGDAYLRQQQAILARPDSCPLLQHIRIPTLIAVGADDRLTPPSDAAAMHAGIAHSRYHVFPRCGHLPPLELPDETVSLLQTWLTADRSDQ